MSDLPQLAALHGFSLQQHYDTVVDNLGSDDQAQFEPFAAHLGRWMMWGLFSFIGQRQEVTKLYQKAERYYYAHTHESMSINIQTQIFTKN